ncbi:MAG: hypothetical protein ACI9OI_000608 [Chitinophagales bacterium]|jgi:uncharacterized protein involved in exopolysaccharide biosynthesis
MLFGFGIIYCHAGDVHCRWRDIMRIIYQFAITVAAVCALKRSDILGNLVDRAGEGIPLEHHSDYVDDEIDLRELCVVLWDGKWWIAGITAVASIIAVVFALSLPNIYQSEALLAPASSSSGGLGGLAKQYGGLASLAGISLPGDGSGDKTVLGLEVMKSRRFIAEFIEHHDLLVPLMASSGWDQSTGDLVIDNGIYESTAKKWVRDVPPPKQPVPSLQEAYQKFEKLLSITEGRKSGFISLSIKHYSPVVAQQWVVWLIEDINNTLREQDVREAERSIAYLKQQVEATLLTDLQAMFFELIQSQTETIMLAKVRQEYVFKTIDPAVVPEKISEPKRALICILGTLLGGVLAGFLVLVVHYTKKSNIQNDRFRSGQLD